MAGSKEVRYMMRKANVNSSQLGELLHISRQGMHNKLVRNTFSYEELLTIADLLGFEAELVIKRKDTLNGER